MGADTGVLRCSEESSWVSGLGLTVELLRLLGVKSHAHHHVEWAWRHSKAGLGRIASHDMMEV